MPRHYRWSPLTGLPTNILNAIFSLLPVIPCSETLDTIAKGLSQHLSQAHGALYPPSFTSGTFMESVPGPVLGHANNEE